MWRGFCAAQEGVPGGPALRAVGHDGGGHHRLRHPGGSCPGHTCKLGYAGVWGMHLCTYGVFIHAAWLSLHAICLRGQSWPRHCLHGRQNTVPVGHCSGANACSPTMRAGWAVGAVPGVNARTTRWHALPDQALPPAPGTARRWWAARSPAPLREKLHRLPEQALPPAPGNARRWWAARSQSRC